ncbi:hypothetical protein [Rariglobus hedericola]|uniref:Uncharacterized protein n=1 Tax=Rariglobus hedericola TaxID=2597822 RepID=A0A556QPM7_9BACT|nr:hypothetical protein [Rariglobus hedericola]TSJ78591.1 hypothetical protein FPL22_04625 [Rariglobus hedericola]
MYIFEHHTPILQSQLVRLLVCALLPACIQEASAGSLTTRPRVRSDAGAARSSPAPLSSPYLLVCLPPPLRFAEPVEIGDVAHRTAHIVGPPHPAGITEEIAASNHDAALTTAPAAPATVNPAETSPDVIPPVVAPLGVPGVTILPDDTPRDIRAEDVLMYFQYARPAPPNTLPPPSSATYQQK